MLPVQIGSTGQLPTLQQDVAASYQAMVSAMQQGVGVSYNFIRPGKLDFSLVENGVARQVPNGTVVGVLLGVSPIDHCTWYEKAYTPGQEPEQPDLVWEWPDHSEFPDALPAQYRQKTVQNGKERWAFRVARRSVWALVNKVNDQSMLDLDNPYIMDITSMSMYGKSDPQNNTYKYNGIISMCQRLGQPGFPVSPAMFLTQIVIDGQAPVSGVVNFRPQILNGALAYLDSVTFNRVVQTGCSQQIQDMLKVREKLEWGTHSTAQSVTPSVPSAPTAASAPTPPTVSPVQPEVVAPAPQPVQSVQQAQPEVVTPAPQPAQPAQPTMTVTPDLLAQANAVLNTLSPEKREEIRAQLAAQQAAKAAQVQEQAAAPGIAVAQGVSPVTANAVNALDSML